MKLPKPPGTRKLGDFTADDALRLSEQHKKKERIQRAVFRKIKRHAKQGYRSCGFFYLNEPTKNELTRLGFSITYEYIPRGNDYTVQW